jgi:hypothetical protein
MSYCFMKISNAIWSERKKRAARKGYNYLCEYILAQWMTMEGLRYENEVIGKWVVTHFNMKNTNEPYPFVGRIRSMKRTEVVTGRPIGDTVAEVHVQVLHQVVFHDGDEVWYDLKEEEENGRLTWVKPLPINTDTIAVAGTNRGRSSAGSQRWSQKKGGSQATTSRSLHNYGSLTQPASLFPATGTKSAVTQNRQQQRQTTDVEAELPCWLHGLHDWLLLRYKNKGSARKVLKQVHGLVSGIGIQFGGWPKGIVFQKDVPVDQNSDFDKLYREAKKFEETYGKDTGNGWLLRIPIQKLHQFVESKAKTTKEEDYDEEETHCSTRSNTAAKRGAADVPLASTNTKKLKSDDINWSQKTSTKENLQANAGTSTTLDSPATPDVAASLAQAVDGETETRDEEHGKRKPEYLRKERPFAPERRITRASSSRRNEENNLKIARPLPSVAYVAAQASQGELRPGQMTLATNEWQERFDKGPLPLWVNDMYAWLRSRSLKESSVQNIMRPVTKLASGKGLTCSQWPAGTVFYRGITVDLHSDFNAIIKDAKEFEDHYGRGARGFLMRPLGMLKLFQATLNQPFQV